METFLASDIITDFNALDKSVFRPVFFISVYTNDDYVL